MQPSDAAAATLLIRNIGQLVDPEGDRVREVRGGALAVRDGVILWAGKESELPSNARPATGSTVIDAGGGAVTPGFIDCHTHLVFAGSREKEFEMRMEGKTYLTILQAGGGILSTVRATRAASEDELVEAALPRLRRLLRFGVTTCEVKTGYGLDTESEIKLLRVIRKLSGLQPVRLVPTLLGAHAVPAEFREKREKYVDIVIREMIPAAAGEGLARFCDVYLEKSAFTAEEAGRILTAARDLGLLPKLHAGQFNDLGGAELGARLGAASVDHLEKVSDEGLGMMAEKGVVAVTLPGAAFFVREKRADCARMRRAGVRVAVSTDLNPGSSPTENLPLMMTMSVVDGGLTLEEALLGVTASAAAALAMPAPHGTLAPGAAADILVHEAGDWRELIYHYAVGSVRSVIIGGKLVP